MTEPADRPRKRPARRRTAGRPLCDLEDIADPGSASFVLKQGARRLSLMVVRRGDEVFGYINSCPHIGAPLDYQVNGFLDQAGQYIRCAYHGALFRMEDGICIAGPPERDCLIRFPLELVEGRILPGPW